MRVIRSVMHVRGFKVNRGVGPGEYKLADVFTGLDGSATLLGVYGSKPEMSKIIRHLKLRVVGTDWGLWLDRDTGTICIGHKHLADAKTDFLYLDVVHVLVHVKQFLEGRELYDQAFEYVERPTELEAYRHTVAEARRIGLREDEILRYLRMDAVDDSELGKLMEKIGVKARR
jgi:hypothetical protein